MEVLRILAILASLLIKQAIEEFRVRANRRDRLMARRWE
jgi:hypothetical protein